MPYDVIIVGQRLLDLSAALHANQNGLHALVVERGYLANIIVDYHRGKYVMEEPTTLPVTADLPCQAGSCESVLGRWEQIVVESDLEIHRPEHVTMVVKTGEQFTVHTARVPMTGDSLFSPWGSGIPRSLRVPGEQYPLT